MCGLQVNASGQFCGVAEMTGQVDFSKSMDFWQQSKWNGYFPVKWHIIKDIPNSQLRHVILHNNENKPVTNSRDTQEVIFLFIYGIIIFIINTFLLMNMFTLTHWACVLPFIIYRWNSIKVSTCWMFSKIIHQPRQY